MISAAPIFQHLYAGCAQRIKSYTDITRTTSPAHPYSAFKPRLAGISARSRGSFCLYFLWISFLDIRTYLNLRLLSSALSRFPFLMSSLDIGQNYHFSLLSSHVVQRAELPVDELKALELHGREVGPPIVVVLVLGFLKEGEFLLETRRARKTVAPPPRPLDDSRRRGGAAVRNGAP